MPTVDTSCIISLLKIGELSLLEKLFSKITVTPEVRAEMHAGVEGLSEFQEALRAWIFVQAPHDTRAIESLSKAESITLADASLIVLAIEKKGILISNDAALLRIARMKGAECWWTTTCVIEAVKRDIVTKKKAREVMLSLISQGMYLDARVYASLLEEIERL